MPCGFLGQRLGGWIYCKKKKKKRGQRRKVLALVFLSKWVVTIINSQMKRVNGYLMAVLQLQFTMCLPLFNFTLFSLIGLYLLLAYPFIIWQGDRENLLQPEEVVIGYQLKFFLRSFIIAYMHACKLFINNSHTNQLSYTFECLIDITNKKSFNFIFINI